MVVEQVGCRRSVTGKDHRQSCANEEVCLDREAAIRHLKLMPQYACAGASVSADQRERRALYLEAAVSAVTLVPSFVYQNRTVSPHQMPHS